MMKHYQCAMEEKKGKYLNPKADNMPTELIAKYTGLDIEIINSL